MASDSEVIKEFLVSVGFKFDQNALGKFNGIMADVGKNMFLLASTLTAAATAIEGFVTIVADKMEDLYWSSQRLNSSVAQIQDYALGISKLGGSAAGARQSLESLAMLIKTNPGMAAMAASLSGRNTTNAVSLMEGLGSFFSRMPAYVGWQYAQRFGIDYQTFLAMQRGDPLKNAGGSGLFNGLYKAIGMDPDKAAKAAMLFTNQLKDMEAEFTVLAQVMAYKLLPFAKIITSWMAQFAENAIRAFASVDPEMWSALADVISQLGTAFGALLPTMKETVSFLTTASKVLAAALKVTKDVLAGDFGKAAGDAKPIGQWAHGTVVGMSEGLDRWIGKVFSGNAGDQQRDALAYFTEKSGSRAFASALVGNLSWESGMNFRKQEKGGPGYGYAQWGPERQALFAKWAGHDIHNSTPQEQNQFIWYEIMNNPRMRAIASAARRGSLAFPDMVRSVMDVYEAPNKAKAHFGDRLAIAQHLAGANVSMTQKTDIHVNGAGQSATWIGSEVARQQRGVAADLLRNSKIVLFGGPASP